MIPVEIYNISPKASARILMFDNIIHPCITHLLFRAAEEGKQEYQYEGELWQLFCKCLL